MENDICIDPEAKTKIELKKITRDANGQPYYIGKQQFPGTLNFECGASFFVFLSEEGQEELQIAPLTTSRRLKSDNDLYVNKSRINIDLHPMVDQNGRTYYVGEAIGLVQLDLIHGIFFTIFTSKPGHEEIQISKLNPKFRKNVEAISKRRPSYSESIAP